MGTKKPHIVIIGAGFGGMYVARALAPAVRSGRIAVTVVNRTNYFLFTPMLHEVATGGLGASSVIEPLREILAGTGVEVVQADAVTLDAAQREVRTTTRIMPYDFAVVATGAATDFRGIPGATEHALGLKTLADAIRIRERIVDAFESAAHEVDVAKRKSMLSFAVIGGGATGVEVAGELAEFVHGIARRYHRQALGAEVSVALVHVGKELLEQFPSTLRAAAAKRLRSRGVALFFGQGVRSVSKDGIILADGGVLATRTVIWTAGVKPALPQLTGLTASNGRISVSAALRAVGNNSVFALGDAAFMETGTGKPLPMLAQVAVAQADVVSRNLLAALLGGISKEFRYESKGSLVSVGQWFAVGEIFSSALRGRFAWWLWRTIYLFKFFSWRKRLRIAFEWTINLFYPRDISKLS